MILFDKISDTKVIYKPSRSSREYQHDGGGN